LVGGLILLAGAPMQKTAYVLRQQLLSGSVSSDLSKSPRIASEERDKVILDVIVRQADQSPW